MSAEKKVLRNTGGGAIEFDGLGLDFTTQSSREYFTLRQFFDALGITLDDCKVAFGELTEEQESIRRMEARR
jgi:hypothetical protein